MPCRQKWGFVANIAAASQTSNTLIQRYKIKVPRPAMSVMTDNLNVKSNDALITPQQLKAELPLAGAAQETVQQARQTIFDILDRKDPRLFVVVGPCSI